MPNLTDLGGDAQRLDEHSKDTSGSLPRLFQHRSALNDPLDAEEQRIRAILHLPKPAPSASPAATPGRHRFVRDGEVTIIALGSRHGPPAPDRNAFAELERALAAERQRHGEVEKALGQARETIRQLQTSLAHAEIARKEAAPSPIKPTPEPTPAEAATPTQSSAAPAVEDEAVEWWKPGWRERFRARSGKAGAKGRAKREP